ncbi:MAG: phosphatidate cytidylyltransferase [Pseudomonadota bacterium]
MPILARVASATVLIPLGLATAHFGGVFAGVMLSVLAALMAVEWNRLIFMDRFDGTAQKVMVVYLLTFVASLALVTLNRTGLGLLILFLAIPLVVGLCLRREDKIVWAVAGLLYVGVPCLSVLALRAPEPEGAPSLFFMLALIWAYDTGAYLAGSVIGGPKFLPRISPNKTWAGVAGGVSAGLLVAGLAALLTPNAPFGPLALLAVALCSLVQAGDLFESWVKRQFGVKDTGQLIPGHGGVLDRLDGALFVFPVAALIGVTTGVYAAVWGGAG